eukprot:scaffold69028_cov41-Attheya_sp.AAC.2
MPLELRMMDRFRHNYGPYNNIRGTIVVGALWCVSAGAAASMALWMGEDTGFASPILMGCWGASLAESGVTVLSELLEGHPPHLDHHAGGRSSSSSYYGRHSAEEDHEQRRRGQRGRRRGQRHGLGRPCWTHLSTTMVQIVLSLFPHSGIYALAGGFGAGLGFGLLLWSPLLRQDAHADLNNEPPTLARSTPDNNNNSNNDTNEATALFGSTPFPRSKFFTATTPLMRRPIHHSPDDEEQAHTNKNNSPTTTSHNNSKSWHRNNNSKSTNNNNNNNNIYKTPACLASMVRLLGIGLIGLTLVLPVTLVGLGLGVNQNLSANNKSRGWKESLTGCRTVFRLFNDEKTSSSSTTTTTTCGEACVPLSLLGMAQRRFQMKKGYCDTFGFRCPVHTEQVTLVTGYNMSVDEYSYYASYSSSSTNDDTSSQSGAACSTTQTNINNDDQQ